MRRTTLVAAGAIVVLGAATWLVVSQPWTSPAAPPRTVTPSTPHQEVRGVIASCVGVDVTPPFVDPRTGEPIVASRVITLAVSMRGYPAGTEVTVPLVLAGQPDSLIELRGVLGPDGRLEAAHAVSRSGTYHGFQFNRTFVVLPDAGTGESAREDHQTREFVPRDGVTVGDTDIPCDKASLPPGSTAPVPN